MADVQINDRIFEAAERRAASGGYSNVAEYVNDLVKRDLEDDEMDRASNLDVLFTPERLAKIEIAEEEIKRGDYVSAEQVRAHFEQKRRAWQENQPR